MDRILILDTDPAHAAAIEDALSAKGFAVVVCDNAQIAAERAREGDAECMVFVARSRAHWKQDVQLIARTIQIRDHAPDILCVLPWAPDGPEDRLYGDALRVGVVHAP